MHEFTTTRTNELIDPGIHLWGWEIAVYLFLGGLVAGMMIIYGFFIYSKRFKETSSSSFYLPIISLILISVGMFALFLDLEHKLYVWRLYVTFKIKSPMSWGAWILILIYPALFANILLHLPEKIKNKFPLLEKISKKINLNFIAIRAIGIINMFLGGLLGMYTGILLSTLGARPLWNSPLLWLLFLVSGLSSAAAFIHLVAKEKEEREFLVKSDNGFLIIELFILAMFIIGMITSSSVHINAAALILNGSFASVFWVFVVGMGIIIPLFIQSLAVKHKIQHTPIAPIMVILGGLILRFVIVFAGQNSHW